MRRYKADTNKTTGENRKRDSTSRIREEERRNVQWCGENDKTEQNRRCHSKSRTKEERRRNEIQEQESIEVNIAKVQQYRKIRVDTTNREQ